MSPWLRPLCCTRPGASHLRKGVVCQDASGWHCFQDRQGEQVQLMAVADGHGGARYGRSDVGSWLACRTALNTARQLFQSQAIVAATPLWPRPSDQGPVPAEPSPQQLLEWQQDQWQQHHWQQWLGQELPQVIQRRWLRAVRRHWRAHRPAAGDEAFSPLLYGTTLGLVVMTPRWWGHTGLGDWDLLQLQASGSQLLSQENDPAAAGEATFSLCLPDAAAHWASRTAIQRLDRDTPPFALLLSTDGIRKSCSTDDDFLALGRYLSQAPLPAAAEPAVDLAASLDRISSQGSGDDVTAAVAHWLPGEPSPPMASSLTGLGPAGPQLQPCRPRSLEPSRRIEVVDPVPNGPVQVDASQAAPIAAPRSATGSGRRPRPGRRRPLAAQVLVGAVLLGGLGAAALALFRFGPLGRVVPLQSPAVQAPMGAERLERVQQQLWELCAGDRPIQPLLVQPQRQQPLARPDLDPLETLIGLSDDAASGAGQQHDAFHGCPSLQQD